MSKISVPAKKNLSCPMSFLFYLVFIRYNEDSVFIVARYTVIPSAHEQRNYDKDYSGAEAH
jgi:hypothetical protein